jgi:hypothetical protein
MGFVLIFFLPSVLLQREDNRENVIVQICPQCSGVIEKCRFCTVPVLFIFCYYCCTEDTLPIIIAVHVMNFRSKYCHLFYYHY